MLLRGPAINNSAERECTKWQDEETAGGGRLRSTYVKRRITRPTRLSRFYVISRGGRESF